MLSLSKHAGTQRVLTEVVYSHHFGGNIGASLPASFDRLKMLT